MRLRAPALAATADSTAASKRPQALAIAYGTAVSAVIGILLLRIPIQLSDSFTEFTDVEGRTLWQVIAAEFYNGAYFRPLRRGLIKIVYDLSAGHYYLAFRGFQAAQVLILMLLVVRMLRVRSRSGMLAVPVGLAMLVGIHTFAGTVREAFPINHFLTILICCAAAVNIAQARRTVATDAAAVVVLLAGMLTLESGLILWVIFVAAYIAGYRGVSRHALIVLTACVVAYFVGRFIIIGGAPPGLNERSAGFGFSVLSPTELMRRFGHNPLPFYVYNVISAISCVLLAEPRGGVWIFTRDLIRAWPEPWEFINVATSMATTFLIVRFIAARAPRWRRREFDDADRFALIFLAVLPANALFAAGYEKDVIMSPAGLFYAVTAYFVFREWLAEGVGGATMRYAAAPLLILLVSVGWSVRFIALHQNLRIRAASVRDEWAYYDDWAREQPPGVPLDAAEESIRQHLLDDAITRAPWAPQLMLGGLDRWLDNSQ
jgi:hypothetical protein